MGAGAKVDVVGDGDGTGTDDRVDVYVRACARRLVDGLQCGDDYLIVKMMMMTMVLLLLVLVMSAGPCVVDMHVHLHFRRVRVNRDESVWAEIR